MPRCLLENRVGSQDYGSADGERAGRRRQPPVRPGPRLDWPVVVLGPSRQRQGARAAGVVGLGRHVAPTGN
jgi:hypothetical protein